MKIQSVKITLLFCSVRTLLFLAACSRAHGDPAAEAPPTPNVVPGADVNLSAMENPERFPVARLGWAENSLLGGASKPRVLLGRFGEIWIVPESMVLAHDRAESWSVFKFGDAPQCRAVRALCARTATEFLFPSSSRPGLWQLLNRGGTSHGGVVVVLQTIGHVWHASTFLALAVSNDAVIESDARCASAKLTNFERGRTLLRHIENPLRSPLGVRNT